MNRIRKIIAAAILAALVTLVLAGCFAWADRECQPHGGLDHMVKIGNSYFGVCKDGKWVSP
jgi:hypothetical protein